MEKALFLNDLRYINLLKNYDRLYCGCEFCQNLIPTLDNLKKIFSETTKQGKKITLVTSYVTELGLEKLKPLFRYLNKQNNQIEIVFNDWGIFKLIREEYGNIQPVLGRLLTKQQRDPRMRSILLNNQQPKTMFNKKTQKKLIFIPKKIPSTFYQHFKGSVINLPIFQQFLLFNKVKRVEIDYLAWDMNIVKNKRIGISVYLPYAYIATTRLCGLVNLSYAGCRKECQKYHFSFKNDSSPLPLYLWGNSLFYKSKVPQDCTLEKIGIDRIVYNSRTPI